MTTGFSFYLLLILFSLFFLYILFLFYLFFLSFPLLFYFLSYVLNKDWMHSPLLEKLGENYKTTSVIPGSMSPAICLYPEHSRCRRLILHLSNLTLNWNSQYHFPFPFIRVPINNCIVLPKHPSWWDCNGKFTVCLPSPLLPLGTCFFPKSSMRFWWDCSASHSWPYADPGRGG